MKKLSFILGMVLVAGVALAQFTPVTPVTITRTNPTTGTANAATVNQTGSNEKAQVAQTGIKNVANVDQSGGDANYIDVVSNGNSNEVDVDQVGPQNGNSPYQNYSLVPHNYVHQSGNNNYAKLDERSDRSDFRIDQLGGFNDAIVTQRGFDHGDNTVGLTQIHTGENTNRNYAKISQSTTGGVTDVSQTGSANLLESTQSGYLNSYTAIQNGVSNSANITQLGGNFGNWGDYDVNKLTQHGDDNKASLTQNGVDNNLYGYGAFHFQVDQQGSGNSTGLNLTLSSADVTQQGNYNTIGGINAAATFTEDVAVFGSTSGLVANQYGDNNKLYVNTNGKLNVTQGALLDPTTIGNTIKYVQTSTEEFTFTQAGDNNLLWLKNTSAANAANFDIDQVGDGNVVASFEDGLATGTKSSASFAGTYLKIDQKGAGDNMLDLNSTGATDYVSVIQDGSNNWASVSQSADIHP
ncbi:MAG TPA: hypothetical protein VFC65_06275 [Prolixibacteraceae bacterium]|nr:hypothetical protein [Prolixibacteraceae bacterium]